MKRINLWSSPRNVSTAMMYAFAQRDDTTVVDEPLYGYYLKHTERQLPHPGKQEILNVMEHSARNVIENILLGAYSTKVVVFKQMTHHLLQLDLSFLLKMKNVLLIRSPEEIITSYARVIPRPDMQDIGIQQQYDLFLFLKKRGSLSAVLDAKTLLQHPKATMKVLCEKLEISFDEKMLHWEAGSRKEDGIWAKYWYGMVHQSTGFMPYRKRPIELTPEQATLARQCAPLYAELSDAAIEVET